MSESNRNSRSRSRSRRRQLNSFTSVQAPLSFNNPRYSDVVVVGPGGSNFHCHRVILAACNDYFDRMFQSGMREAQKQEIQIHEAASDRILELLLLAMYSGSSIKAAELDEVLPLHRLADYIGARDVAEKCLERLRETCSRYNALSIFVSVPDTPAAAALHEVCMFEMGIDFEEICQTSEFRQLSIHQVAKFAKANIDVHEIRMFKAVMAWVGSDMEDREQHIATLLHTVRFALMTAAELADISAHPVASKAWPVFSDLLSRASPASLAHNGQPDAFNAELREPRGPSTGPRTWDPRDKGDTMVLSEGNLVVTAALGDHRIVCLCVRAAYAFNIAYANKMYWEAIILDAREIKGIAIGVARREAALSGRRYACFRERGWGICVDDGMAIHDANFSLVANDWPALTTGTRVGVLCHRGAIYFYRDGALLGGAWAFSGLDGYVFPAAYLHRRGQAIRADFFAQPSHMPSDIEA